MILQEKGNLEKNLKAWKEKHKAILPQGAPSRYEFCKTGKKEELNLREKGSGKTLYSAQNIEVEVRQWMGLFDPHKVEWLIVYGVGLGYYYLALRDWLAGSARRKVVFIEDDPEIMEKFFETDAATLLLNDPKADLIFQQDREVASADYLLFLQDALFRPHHMGALAFYLMQRRGEFEQVEFMFNFYHHMQASATAEYLFKGTIFFSNFYKNILSLNKSVNGTYLEGCFKGIPAIICGAGPSLEKNVGVLKELKDKALIIAGGTAMNALNGYGLVPHFGVGIDPFETHLSRIISNLAYETPYFFRSRMNFEALRMIHGEKVYLPGAGGYPLADWIDQKLGYAPLNIEEGANVINMSLSLAKWLGCDPIIAVGLDLAYSDGLSYAKGMTSHGILDPREQFVTKGPTEELVQALDIYGRPVYTLVKWMIESSWYTQFVKKHPGMTFINATEGGIGFGGVRNIPLEEVAKTFLQKTWDLNGKVSEGILSAKTHPGPSFEEIRKVLSSLVKSLKTCADFFQSIKVNHPAAWEGKEELEDNLFSQIAQEPAYEYLLGPFDRAYQSYMGASSAYSAVQEGLKPRFPYLLEIVLDNLKFIEKALKSDQVHPGSSNLENKVEIPSAASSSIFYYPTGELLSRSSFIDDKKEGRAQTFAKNGQILSDLIFKNGLEEGEHLYYYPDGQIKSSIQYSQGVLNGPVKLYYPNQLLRRSLTYRLGRRQGFDLTYYENGQLSLQAEYKEDLPIGTAKSWYPDGTLSLEITYFTPGHIAEIRRFDHEGKLVSEGLDKKDFFDLLTLNSLRLKKSIGDMKRQFDKVAAPFKHESKLLQSDLEALTKEMSGFEEMGEILLRLSGMGGDDKESIWKTPSNQETLYGYIQDVALPMHESMLKLQWKLKNMKQSLEDRADDKK